MLLFCLMAPEVIRKKISRATTDSLKSIQFDESRPAINNLLVLYEACSGMDRKSIEAHFEGKGYGDFKKDLADVIIARLEPIQKKYRELTSDKEYIKTLLRTSADTLSPIADKTVSSVKKKVGLGV